MKNTNNGNSSEIVFDENTPGEVETWENERWYPVAGWSKNLLPTDRKEWSTKDGREERVRQVSFPDSKYYWDGEWEIDINHPETTDEQGWTYARDFPASYAPKWFFGVCVRRRRWIRKYRGMKKK